MEFSRQEYWSGFTISYFRGSSQPRDQTHISCISCMGRRILYHCSTWEAFAVLLNNFYNIRIIWCWRFGGIPMWNLLRLVLFHMVKVKVKVKSLRRVWLFVTPWTVAHQAPPSMGFSRQEHWSGLPFPSPLGMVVPPSFLYFFHGNGCMRLCFVCLSALLTAKPCSGGQWRGSMKITYRDLVNFLFISLVNI